MANDDLLTLEDAAPVIGLTAGRLRQFIKDGRLSGKKYGKVWLVSRDDLAAFNEKPRTNGRPRTRPLSPA